MDDLELIKLAGKAAEIEYTPENNPLNDDALALRLMVNLGMDILFYGYKQTIIAVTHRTTTQEPYSFDMEASTRRAIVKAAAEIGKHK